MVALGEPVQGSPIVLFVPYGVKLLDAAIWDGANSQMPAY